MFVEGERLLIGVSEMCIVQRTRHQEQFFMRFSAAVLPADICHLACAEGWMSKVWAKTLTVYTVLYIHSIFFAVKTVATRPSGINCNTETTNSKLFPGA